MGQSSSSAALSRTQGAGQALCSPHPTPLEEAWGSPKGGAGDPGASTLSLRDSPGYTTWVAWLGLCELCDLDWAPSSRPASVSPLAQIGTECPSPWAPVGVTGPLGAY